MPRTSRLESPGCPPLRVLTSDVLGLVKVTESRGKSGTPRVVETWGSPDASRGVVAASFAQDAVHPLFAVARKDGSVELRSPLNGDLLSSFLLREIGSEGQIARDDVIVGLHAFKWKQSKSGALLFCTGNRKACLKSFKFKDGSDGDSPDIWDVCAAGQILCSSLDRDHSHALFAGKGVEVNVWDLDARQKIWAAKSVSSSFSVLPKSLFVCIISTKNLILVKLLVAKPPANSLGIFTPTWFTVASFLGEHDRRRIVAGTNNHQVRLYDTCSQRRPVLSMDFRESSIRSIAEDVDGNTVYVGTGAGDLASFDMRTGKLLGCFVGKCCGSIRSIERHPHLPVLASCGIDGYLRLWDTATRQPLSAVCIEFSPSRIILYFSIPIRLILQLLIEQVFLKQHLTHLAFDLNFSDEEVPATGIADEQFNSEVDDLEEQEPAASGRQSNERSKSRRKRSELEDGGRESRENRKTREKKKRKHQPRAEDPRDEDVAP